METPTRAAQLKAQIDAVTSPMDGTLGKLLGHSFALTRELELYRALAAQLEAAVAERDRELRAARDLLAQRPAETAEAA